MKLEENQQEVKEATSKKSKSKGKKHDKITNGTSNWSSFLSSQKTQNQQSPGNQSQIQAVSLDC